MFKKPSDVFKVVREIKEEPTHFLKNYDDKVALIAKILKDNKAGNIAIKKDDGKIIHVNKTKKKDLERLSRRNNEMLTGTPLPATTKGIQNTDVGGDLLQHLEDFTQKEHKPSLSESEPNQPLKDNESTTIQANQHLGAGLFGGMINGLSEDENGNLTFNPQDFLKGFAAGGLGSLGMNKALKVIKQNPQLKRNLLNELKKSLSITHGDLAKVYPVFKNTQRFKATKKDKALNIQAKAALRDLQIENMQDVLKNLNINPLPRELNEEEIQGLLKSFDNEKNIKEHLFTRTDSKTRKSLFRLLKDTQNDPQIHYIKNGRDKKVKRYKGDENEPYFYVLITQDKDKTFITHFKNTDEKYLSKELINADKIIKDADIIETLRRQTGDNKVSTHDANSN